MWIALLLLGFLIEGSVSVDPECESTQKVDIYLVSNYWQTGAADVAALSLRSTVAEAKTFAEQYRKIYKVYGLSIGKTDYNQIVGIGKNLIDTIKKLWVQLQQSIKETPECKNNQPSDVNSDLDKMNNQLETFLNLKPGNQEIESDLSEMPAQPTFKSDNKNLTAADAFLNFVKIKDRELSAEMAFGCSMYWNGWKNARKSLRLLQTQYRNQILNKQVMPVYRRVVDDVYSCGNQSCVDPKTWDRFVSLRKSIDEISDAYIKSLLVTDDSSITQCAANENTQIL